MYIEEIKLNDFNLLGVYSIATGQVKRYPVNDMLINSISVL